MQLRVKNDASNNVAEVCPEQGARCCRTHKSGASDSVLGIRLLFVKPGGGGALLCLGVPSHGSHPPPCHSHNLCHPAILVWTVASASNFAHIRTLRTSHISEHCVVIHTMHEPSSDHALCIQSKMEHTGWADSPWPSPPEPSGTPESGA